MAKAEGTYVEKDKKERQKRNKAERGGWLHICCIPGQPLSMHAGWALPVMGCQLATGADRECGHADRLMERGKNKVAGVMPPAAAGMVRRSSQDCSCTACMAMQLGPILSRNPSSSTVVCQSAAG